MYKKTDFDVDTELEYDFLQKIVLVGDSGVGKSNLLSRWAVDEFNDESKSTIGVEFAAKNIIINKKIVKAQIWDTAGQERYRAITGAYYRGAVGALIVYDVTDIRTFEHVDIWLDQLLYHVGSHLGIIMIGNKCDLETRRKVAIEDAKNYAISKNIMFIETSAKNNENVDKAFKDLIVSIHEKNQNAITNTTKDDIVSVSQELVSLDARVKISEKSKCCKN